MVKIMETRPITFVHFNLDTNYLYGLDKEGKLWFREKPPYSYNTSYYTANTSPKEKEKKEEAAIWKPVEMFAQVVYPPLPEKRTIDAKEEEALEPIKVEKVEEVKPETSNKQDVIDGSTPDKAIQLRCAECKYMVDYAPYKINEANEAEAYCNTCRTHKPITSKIEIGKWYSYDNKLNKVSQCLLDTKQRGFVNVNNCKPIIWQAETQPRFYEEY